MIRVYLKSFECAFASAQTKRNKSVLSAYDINAQIDCSTIMSDAPIAPDSFVTNNNNEQLCLSETPPDQIINANNLNN